ncbi:MAG: hypothetical protein WCS87_03000 [Methylococcaceae bacterium]
MKNFSSRLAKLEEKTRKPDEKTLNLTDAELNRILFDDWEIEGLTPDEINVLFMEKYPD